MRLLDPASFPPRRREGEEASWRPQRDSAVVALCWIVGLRPEEIQSLTRGAWMPRGEALVIPPTGSGSRERRATSPLPVLERARDAVATYLRAYPSPLPDDGPLIRRPDGGAFAKTDIIALNAVLRVMPGKVVPSLYDITGRFRRYLENTGATDGTVESLVGNTGLYDDLAPDLRRMRRLLERVHPASITNLPR